MKKLFKTIKSFFVKDKFSCYVYCTNKEYMVENVIINQVRIANSCCRDHMFSIIPTSRFITIKCQTYHDIYSSTVINPVHCMMFSKEELIDYIDKILKVLINETNSSLNCYKADKHEKNN